MGYRASESTLVDPSVYTFSRYPFFFLLFSMVPSLALSILSQSFLISVHLSIILLTSSSFRTRRSCYDMT